jgi:hypothetical protein
MRRVLIWMLAAAVFAIPARSWEATSTSQNLSITVTAAQAITAVNLSGSSFTGGAPSGTVVGAISVTMSPSSPPFSGTLSVTGTNASRFQIVGSNLETNGIVPTGTYQINIVATQAGASASPFTQPETITGAGSTSGGGLLPADRDASANWRMAGLLSVGGIPNRTTQCGATINPRGSGQDDTANIQAAINACPAGQVVQLSAGSFTIAEGSYILLNKAITVRGAGPGSTVLTRPTGPGCPPAAGSGATLNCSSGGNNPSEMIHISPVGRYVPDNVTPCALTSDAAAGTYQVTVSSACASLFAPGQQVLLDELSGAQWMPDPEHPNNQIWASSDYRVVYNMHNPGVGGDDGANVKCDYTINCDRVTNEIKQVKSVSGNTITFDSPVMISYRVSHTADLWHFQTPFLQMAGVEALTTQYADNGSVEMDFCAYCWVYQVETRYYIGPSIALLFSFRPQLEQFYVHEAAWPVPGGAGYNIDLKYDTSEALIENGISVLADKLMVARGSGSGSVIAYNYVDKQYIRDQTGWQEIGLNASHLVGPHHILFEGNWAANMDSDATHGNSVYLTFFRNQSTGIRGMFTGIDNGVVQDDSAGGCTGGSPARTTGPQAYTYWTSFVGNVLGVPGCTVATNGWLLNNSFGGPNNSDGIFLLGWYNGGNQVNDPSVATIFPATPPSVNGTQSSCMSSGTNCATIMDGNYDHFRNQITWASNDTAHTLPNSLYLPGKPAFFNAGSGYTWPWVNPAGAPQVATGPAGCGGTCSGLPAKARSDAGAPFTQP